MPLLSVFSYLLFYHNILILDTPQKVDWLVLILFPLKTALKRGLREEMKNYGGHLKDKFLQTKKKVGNGVLGH